MLRKEGWFEVCSGRAPVRVAGRPAVARVGQRMSNGAGLGVSRGGRMCSLTYVGPARKWSIMPCPEGELWDIFGLEGSGGATVKSLETWLKPQPVQT